MNLKLDFCSFEAAKYAVMNWHYSKAMPAGKLVKVGVWENKKFIGAVIFGRGANQFVPKSLGLKVTECCELVRVALNKHISPTTKIVSIALKMLKKVNEGIKTVFSYADWTNQKHKGIIYKAGNWKRHGIRSSEGGHFLDKNGRIVHNRTLNAKYGTKSNYPNEYVKAPVQEKYFFTYELRR
jgi:hypothetical protein